MSKRVLIVEDEPNITEALSFVLERAGYVVDAVRDGAAALEAIDRARPDVMLLDVMLPGESGFEILKKIRSDPALAELRVVMLTAKGQAQDRETAEEIGADLFLTKPFSNQEVVDHLKRLVEP